MDERERLNHLKGLYQSLLAGDEVVDFVEHQPNEYRVMIKHILPPKNGIAYENFEIVSSITTYCLQPRNTNE